MCAAEGRSAWCDCTGIEALLGKDWVEGEKLQPMFYTWKRIVMENMCLFANLYNSNSLFISIIAINMTIIGLTSLADAKSVVGIDYGKFLVNKYRLFDRVRFVHLLQIFALSNIAALFFLFLQNEIVRMVIFVVLIINLGFAIIYFFRFILITNEKVVKAICVNELYGCYKKSGEEVKLAADRLAGMHTGSSTDKQMPMAVTASFNVYGQDSSEQFKRLFGPTSFLYDPETINKMYISRQDKKSFEAYDYTGDYSGKQYHHITFEFFMLLRHTDIPERWSIEILKMFFEYGKDCPEFKLDCFNRVMNCINNFCKGKSVYGYKYLDNLVPFVQKIGLIDMSKKHQRKKYIYAVEQITELTLAALEYDSSHVMEQQSEKIAKIIFSCPTCNCNQCLEILTSCLDQIENRQCRNQVKVFRNALIRCFTDKIGDRKKLKEDMKKYTKKIHDKDLREKLYKIV